MTHKETINGPNCEAWKQEMIRHKVWKAVVKNQVSRLGMVHEEESRWDFMG